MSITNPYVDGKCPPSLRGGKVQMPSIVTHHQSKPGEALHGQGATYPVPTLLSPPSRWWSLRWNPPNNLPRANVAVRWKPGSGKKGRKRNWERFKKRMHTRTSALFSETNLWKRPIYVPFFEKVAHVPPRLRGDNVTSLEFEELHSSRPGVDPRKQKTCRLFFIWQDGQFSGDAKTVYTLRRKPQKNQVWCMSRAYTAAKTKIDDHP